MFETAECPYCGHENDMTGSFERLGDDNIFDWKCSNCEKEFRVEVEPVFTASKIEYIDCEKCGTNTRDICEKGSIFPYPKHISENKICKSCFRKAYAKELDAG